MTEKEAYSELTHDRADALLRGVIPVFDASLSEAYGIGVRLIGSSLDNVVHDEFKPLEICSLLNAGGSLRRLGLYMLHNLTQKAQEGQEGSKKIVDVCLKNKLLLLLSTISMDISLELLPCASTGNDDAVFLSDLTLIAQICHHICCSEIYPDDKEIDIQSDLNYRLLSGTAANLLCDLANIPYENKDSDAAIKRLQIYSKLFSTWRWLYRHPGNKIIDTDDSCFRNELNETKFAAACFGTLRRYAGRKETQHVAQMIFTGTNYKLFCEAISNETVNGYKVLIETLGSTCHDEVSTEFLFLAAANIASATCGDKKYARILIDNGALLFLQPALMHSNTAIVVNAAYTIVSLAQIDGIIDLVAESKALDVVEEALQMISPGSVKVLGYLEPADIAPVSALLILDAPPPTLMAALHTLAASIWIKENKDVVVNSQQIVAAIRSVASSNNAFVYGIAAYIMHELDLPIPSYRSHKQSSQQLIAQNVANWSIDDVCAWAGTKCFKQYRHIFRESFVCGRLLLALTDNDLAAMGVVHPLHRRSMLLAIGDIKSAVEGDEPLAGKSSLGGHSSLVRIPSTIDIKSDTYDVFISYRRLGGADFAHLLKISLSLMGLSVFLDIDNLGTGNFDAKLMSSLQCSSNVILVWTKGCFDRFLNDSDPLFQDFVRKEYAVALKEKKNIVPVYKEDFVFPDVATLPDDVKGVLSVNAIKFIGEYREASLEKIKKSLILLPR